MGKRRVLRPRHRARNHAEETRLCASVSAFIKHQTSYINHVSMDPFSYLSPDFDHPGLGNDAGPGRRRRNAAGALASPPLLVHAVWIANLFLYLVVAW